MPCHACTTRQSDIVKRSSGSGVSASPRTSRLSEAVSAATTTEELLAATEALLDDNADPFAIDVPANEMIDLTAPYHIPRGGWREEPYTW
jgi:hypothetical protein